jgi:hypothetical protein
VKDLAARDHGWYNKQLMSPGSAESQYLVGGRPVGYDVAIGDYFLVKFPAWPAAEHYEFLWDAASPGPFQQLTL